MRSTKLSRRRCPIRALMGCLLLCVVAVSVHGQTPTTAHHYKLLIEAPVYRCDLAGRTLDTTLYVGPQHAVFTVVGSVGNDQIVRFWEWEDNEQNNRALVFTDSSKQEYRYFLLVGEEFAAKTQPRRSRTVGFTLGSTVLPFRIRSNPYELAGEFSFGTTFGATFPLSDYRDIDLSVVGGLHLTHISLDSLDTRGAVRTGSGDQEPALSPLFGAVLEVSSVQVGLFAGWDLLNRPDSDNWIYQGKPWVSIGIGAAIFSRQPGGGRGRNTQP